MEPDEHRPPAGHSAIDTYPGFDPSVQNHRRYPPAGHEYNISELLIVSHALYVLRASLRKKGYLGFILILCSVATANGPSKRFFDFLEFPFPDRSTSDSESLDAVYYPIS